VKPPIFQYSSPTTVPDAVALLVEHADDDARVLAGGQSLVPLMNFRLAHPGFLVDLRRVAGLDAIRMDGDVLVIGAMVRQAAAERSAEVAMAAPLLAEALGHVAHPPIRNSGTVVGSVAHGPFTTALDSDEILTEVRFPGFPGGHAFVEFSRTHGNFAVVGVAALVAVTDGRVTRAAIAASGVGPTPLRLAAAEQALGRSVPDSAAIGAAVDAGVAGLQPAGDLQGSTETRLDIARAVLRNAIERAVERAQDRR
jgi:carbon-monoxide dehydrogenase medium subunit